MYDFREVRHIYLVIIFERLIPPDLARSKEPSKITRGTIPQAIQISKKGNGQERVIKIEMVSENSLVFILKP